MVALSFLLVAVLAPSLGLAAGDQRQVVTATGACSIAIAASGDAIVKVEGGCDAQVVSKVRALVLTVQHLERELTAKSDASAVSRLQHQMAEQQSQLTRYITLVTTLQAQAEAPGAPQTAKDAFAAIPQDIAPAVAELRQDAAASTGAGAAQLYIQVATLERTQDLSAAFADAQKAVVADPSSLAGLNLAADLGLLLGRTTDARVYVGKLNAVASVAVATDAQDMQARLAFLGAREDLIDVTSRAGLSVNSLDVCIATETVLAKWRAAAPNDADFAREATVLDNQCAASFLVSGDPAKAKNQVDAAVAVEKVWLPKYPDSQGWPREASVSQMELGDVDAASDDHSDALAAFQAALSQTSGLRIKSPVDTDLATDAAEEYIRISREAHALGSDDKSSSAISDASRLLTQLIGLDASNTVWKSDLARLDQYRGDIELAHNDVDGAIRDCTVGSTILHAMLATDPGNATVTFAAIGEDRCLMAAYQKEGKPSLARATWVDSQQLILGSNAPNANLELSIADAELSLDAADMADVFSISERRADLAIQTRRFEILVVSGAGPLAQKTLDRLFTKSRALRAPRSATAGNAGTS